MTVIPKVQMVYKISFFKQIGEFYSEEGLLRTHYVKPEHIHYWIGPDYSEEGLKVVYNRVWVSPKKFAEI